MAQGAVRYYGMFGEEESFISKDKDQTLDAYNAIVD